MNAVTRSQAARPRGARFDLLHQPAADHDGIGERGDGTCGGGVANAEADADRQLEVRTNAAELRLRSFRQIQMCPRR